jgi:trimeric autotransporter adhesin
MLNNYFRRKNLLRSAAVAILAFGGTLASSYAQITGTYTIPSTTYPTIASAITSLNTSGVGTGGVTFNVNAGHTETGSLPVVTATGSITNPIIFQKSGTGLNPRVNAGVGTGTSDGILILSGTDHITFDGLDFQESTSNTTTTTQMEWGIALLKPSAMDGCQYVTIKNCRVILNKTNVNSRGIYFGNHTPASTVAFTVSDMLGTNSFNKIFNNFITNVYTGMWLNGPLTQAFYDTDNEIGVDGANTFTNFGGAATVTYAIYTIYQNNMKIANNVINGGAGSTGTVYGIFVSTASGASYDVYNNNITLAMAGTWNSCYGMYLTGGALLTGVVNEIKVYNNTIGNFDLSANTEGWAYPFYTFASAAIFKIYNNTITNISVPGGGCYGAYASCGTNTALEFYGNTISNIARTNTTINSSLYGVWFGTAGANSTFYNNTIDNITQAGPGITYAFYASNSTNAPYYNNNVTRIKSDGAGPMYGLFFTSSMNSDIYENKVDSVICAGGSSYGAYFGTGTFRFKRNKITTVQAGGASVVAGGIYMVSGNCTFENNLIGDISAPFGSGVDVARGIWIGGGTTCNLYHNTIFMNGATLLPSSSNYGSSGISITTTATTIAFDFRNNIIINKSTPSGTARAVALRRTNTVTTTFSSNSNNNLYYAGVPAGNRAIYFDGTNVDSTIVQFKQRFSPRENFSVTEDVPFASIVPSNSNYLRPASNTPTFAEGFAQTMTSITDDYSAVNSRTNYPKANQLNGGGYTPDLGAIEGDYTPKVIVDIGAGTMASPSIGNCYGTNSTISVLVRNYTGSLLNMANDPVTVTARVTNPAGIITTFPAVTVNSGTLLPGAGQAVVVSTTYNMSDFGSYTFSANATSANDVEVTNDTLLSYVFVKATGTAAASRNSICAFTPITLSLTGSSGTIQWQQSTDNGTTWTNATGTGNTSATFNTSPTMTTLFRASVCGAFSNIDTVNATVVTTPVVNNAARCGAGQVTLNATSGPNTILRWFNQAVGGNVLHTGNTYQPNVTSSSLYYVEAVSGGAGNDSLTTTFIGGNGSSGNMFDITAVNTVTITGLAGALNTGTGTVEIWYRVGTHVGFTTSNAGWTQIGTASVTSTGATVATYVPIPMSITIPAGQTYAFYFTSTAGVAYTNGTAIGNTLAQNSEMVVKEGHGGSYFAVTIATRNWNGRIFYEAGCKSQRAQALVDVTPAPTITMTASTNAICQNDTVNFNVSSSNPNYVYNWSPANAFPTSAGSAVAGFPQATGAYSVVANDPNTGCEAQASVNIEVTAAPTATVSASATQVCSGSSVNLNTAAVAAAGTWLGNNTKQNTSTGYPAPYGNWFWGAKHQMLIRASDLIAQGYAVGPMTALSFDITNVNSCPTLNNVSVSIGHTSLAALTTVFVTGLTTVFTAPSYTPVNGINTHTFSSPFNWDGVSNIVVEFCFNNSSFLSAGNASFKTTAFSYAATNMFYTDAPGVCANTSGSTSNDRPDIRLTQVIPINYSWSPASTLNDPTIKTPVATPITTTTYTVFATNPLTTCVGRDSIQINVNALPDVDFIENNISCHGLVDGELEVNILNNNGQPYTYSWAHNQNATTGLVTGLGAGTYSASATDNFGCVGTATAVIIEPDPVSVSFATQMVDCYGNGNGQATAVPTGGTGSAVNFSYNWNHTAANTALITNLTPGTYSVTVADINGCSEIGSVTITEPTEVALTTLTTNVDCNGNATGEAIANATGGTGAFTYIWSNGANNSVAGNLTAGNYTVTAQDANGCQKIASVTIDQPDAIVASVSSKDVTCAGLNNGSASLGIIGGTGFYNVTWNTVPVQIGTTASNLSPGNYTATITDNNGCTKLATTTIAQGINAPSADFNMAQNNPNNLYEFTFSDASTGATAWAWNFGDGSPLVQGQTVTHTYTTNGTYAVTLTVSNACGEKTVAKVSTVAVGIENMSTDNYNLVLYPNPTRSSFTVKFENKEVDALEVRVLNMSGQVVFTESRTQINGSYQNTIDLSNFASGVYTLQVISDNGVATRRVVLNK